MSNDGLIICKLSSSLIARRDLTSTAKLLYLYLKDRQGKNDMAWPAVRRIAVDLGVAVSTAVQAVSDLEAANLIKVQHAGPNRHHDTNNYAVCAENEHRPKSGTCSKRARGCTENKHRAVLKTGNEPPSVNHLHRTSSSRPARARHAEPTRRCTAAAGKDAPLDPAIVAALTAAGVDQPTRTELARAWHGRPDAADRIAKLAEELRVHGKRSGAIVNGLRAEIEREDTRTAQAKAAAATQGGDRRKREAQRQADEEAAAQERAEEDAILDGLSDADVTRVVNQLQPKAPDGRELTKPENWRRRPYWRSLILAKVRADRANALADVGPAAARSAAPVAPGTGRRLPKTRPVDPGATPAAGTG